eukprot:TRINITY_DN66573_c9_g4_i1.p1 TRINITY_DN66573_c9_g4~~TRINITY_DN66573_c9_g4_i1.p1  ORF type:complete len:640 (+),score=100.60 TRINITY_DN66573_c9_g4_i1:15-1934(+)
MSQKVTIGDPGDTLKFVQTYNEDLPSNHVYKHNRTSSGSSMDNEKGGVLRVTVLHGDNVVLPSPSKNIPYVLLRLAGHARATLAMKVKGNQPVWNEDIEMDLDDKHTQPLEVTLLDLNRWKQDTQLGHGVRCPLKKLRYYTPVVCNMDMGIGKIVVSLLFLPPGFGGGANGKARRKKKQVVHKVISREGDEAKGSGSSGQLQAQVSQNPTGRPLITPHVKNDHHRDKHRPSDKKLPSASNNNNNNKDENPRGSSGSTGDDEVYDPNVYNDYGSDVENMASGSGAVDKQVDKRSSNGSSSGAVVDKAEHPHANNNHHHHHGHPQQSNNVNNSNNANHTSNKDLLAAARNTLEVGLDKLHVKPGGRGVDKGREAEPVGGPPPPGSTKHAVAVVVDPVDPPLHQPANAGGHVNHGKGPSNPSVPLPNQAPPNVTPYHLTPQPQPAQPQKKPALPTPPQPQPQGTRHSPPPPSAAPQPQPQPPVIQNGTDVSPPKAADAARQRYSSPTRSGPSPVPVQQILNPQKQHPNQQQFPHQHPHQHQHQHQHHHNNHNQHPQQHQPHQQQHVHPQQHQQQDFYANAHAANHNQHAGNHNQPSQGYYMYQPAGNGISPRNSGQNFYQQAQPQPQHNRYSGGHVGAYNHW